MTDQYKQKLLDLIVEVEVYLSHLKKDVETGIFSADTMSFIVETANKIPALMYNLTKLKYNSKIEEISSVVDNREIGKW